ncbi:hypothetical protein [Couchioplanes caeruleus]|uniref:WD40 repeat protein n=2 Tax=Couchioplanes caeruleus TaxID=56438 RepID=A0A1K0G0S7_9ACTN|nr:hypothetical protein [Couchioplanes caeruleus]OJF10906.1 hypothetical protein BG844_29420 [Couchioplanes caeruleus subsp. caeruleus]ROP32646.1 hypothetical protein EDD30_5591 [Couchioplanes caeruleus]
MRRLVFPALMASGLVMVGAVPASAEPAPAATSAKAAAGKKVCKVTDPLLNELSGIVATDDGYVVINDSTDAQRQKVFFLDKNCAIADQVAFSGNGPRDTEDLILSPDGKTLWIADTGDNNVRTKSAEPRETISVWSMPADGSKKPKIHRLAYPAGDRHDAEALLLDGAGKPIIITKEITGPAQLYTPASALKTDNTEGVPLKKVGQVELPRTDTPGTSFARLAQSVVTGAAIAPGGNKVVIRTYLDAFEWDVTNGDVIAALKQKPRGTGLPNEPFGEAISYSADGKTFATVSDFGQQEDQEADNYILRYTPATTIAQASTKGAKDAKSSEGPSWYSDLSLSDITYLVGGIGVLGAILVGAGVFGIMRSRKKPQPELAVKNPDPTGPDPLDAETELLTVGGPKPKAGVYGAGAAGAGAAGAGAAGAGAAASAPGVYGAKQHPKAGGVYGGAAGRPSGGAQPGQPGGGVQGRPGTIHGRPNGAQSGRPGAAQPGGPGAVQPGRPGGAQPGRPGGGPQGRAGGVGQPAGGGQPVARPTSGQPARPGGGQPGHPDGGQPGHPHAGQPSRPTGRQAGGPGNAAQPGRPSAVAQPVPPGGAAPVRPSGAAQPVRPSGAAQPVRPSGAAPTGRPSGAGRPGSLGGAAQPGRSEGAAPVRPAQGAQPGNRPASGGPSGPPSGGPSSNGPSSGGRGGSVYGAPLSSSAAPPPSWPPASQPTGGGHPNGG